MVCSELPGGCRRWLGPSVPICQPSWAEAGPDTGSRFERGRLYVVHCSLGPQLLGTSSRVAESRETFATTGVTLRPRCLFGAHPGGPGEIDKLSLAASLFRAREPRRLFAREEALPLLRGQL